jgi:hypothetical protein
MSDKVIASRLISVRDDSIVELVSLVDDRNAFSWRLYEIAADAYPPLNARKHANDFAGQATLLSSTKSSSSGSGYEPDQPTLEAAQSAGTSEMGIVSSLWEQATNPSRLTSFSLGAAIVVALLAVALMLMWIVGWFFTFPNGSVVNRLVFYVYLAMVLLLAGLGFVGLSSGATSPMPGLARAVFSQFATSLRAAFGGNLRPLLGSRRLIGDLLQNFGGVLIWYISIPDLARTLSIQRASAIYGYRVASHPIFRGTGRGEWAMGKLGKLIFQRYQQSTQAIVLGQVGLPLMLGLLMLAREYLTFIAPSVDFIVGLTVFALLLIYAGWIVGVPAIVQLSWVNRVPVLPYVALAIAHLITLTLLILYFGHHLHGRPWSWQEALETALTAGKIDQAGCPLTLSCGSTIETFLKIAQVGFYLAIVKSLAAALVTMVRGPSDASLIIQAGRELLVHADTGATRGLLDRVKNDNILSLALKLETELLDGNLDKGLELSRRRLAIAGGILDADCALTSLAIGVVSHDLSVDKRVKIYKYAQAKGMSFPAFVNMVETIEQTQGRSISLLCEAWWKLFGQSGHPDQGFADASLRAACGIPIPDEAQVLARLGAEDELLKELLALRAALFDPSQNGRSDIDTVVGRIDEILAKRDHKWQVMTAKYLLNTSYLCELVNGDGSWKGVRGMGNHLWNKATEAADASTMVLLMDHHDLVQANAAIVRGGEGIIT